jgi:hypothetical protein
MKDDICIIYTQTDKGHDVNGNPKRYIDAWEVPVACTKIKQIIEHSNENYRGELGLIQYHLKDMGYDYQRDDYHKILKLGKYR